MTVLNNNYLQLALLAAGIAVASCRNEASTFPEGISLTGKIVLPSDSLKDPRFLTVAGGKLIIGNYEGEPLVEVYSVNDFRKENSFLKRGRGPGEILYLGHIQPLFKENTLLFYDLMKSRLMAMPFDQLTVKGTMPVVHEAFSPDSLFSLGKIFSINDGYYVAENYDSRGRVCVLSHSGERLGYFLEYPDVKDTGLDISPEEHASLYKATIAVSPDRDHFIVATYNAGIISLCSIDGRLVTEDWKCSLFNPTGFTSISTPDGKSVMVQTDHSVKGFLHTAATGETAYALYSGKRLSDSTYMYGNEIYAMDWSGKYPRKYVLDRQVNRFTVSDGFIYCVDKEYNIIRYQIRNEVYPWKQISILPILPCIRWDVEF